MHPLSHECNNAQHAATHMHLQRGAGGCYIATRHFAVHCHTLQHAATQCSKQAPAAPSGRLLCCNTTLCNTLSTLQHTATHTHLQNGAGSFDIAPQTRCNALQHAATRCNTYVSAKRSGWLLHCNTTHCNTLQRTATHCNAPQHTATHAERSGVLLYCNTRHCTKTKYTATQVHLQSRAGGCYTANQHTVTHCNTLQHTATHSHLQSDTRGSYSCHGDCRHSHNVLVTP